MKATAMPAPSAGRKTGPARRSTKGGWTEDEDELLLQVVSKFNGKNWKKIAEFFPNRSDVQCLHRWQKEDDHIIDLVNKYGTQRWSFIAKLLEGRIGKQCRESLDYTVRAFEFMKKKDVVTWTALISAYGMYGQGEKALKTFENMEETGVKPDHIAFIAVLYACSHAGCVEEGKAIFMRMDKDYKVVPRMEHYACMVDLLSRSGELVEAEKFLESVPIEPDVSIWGALLSACHISCDFTMAERVAGRVMTLDSENTGYYVLASNVYASIGKWDMASNIRRSMKIKKLKKDQGLSWIEIGDKVYVFGAGDQVVGQSDEIYLELQRLDALMAKEGYVPDRKLVLQDVEEEDKGYMLCTHSERLAIAFGLLNTKSGTPLQIMKNLRVCGDCHTATKLISRIVQRELLVRDANRFHFFKDGSCSCGDRW